MINDIIEQDVLETSYNTDKTAAIMLKAGQQLVVQSTKKKITSAYKLVGDTKLVNISTSGKKEWVMQGIDFITELLLLNKGEQLAMLMIKQRIQWDKQLSGFNYIVSIGDYDFDSSSAYKYFLKAYKSLHKKNLVRRVSKGKYMINPQALIPSKHLEIFNLIWNSAPPHADIGADINHQPDPSNPVTASTQELINQLI